MGQKLPENEQVYSMDLHEQISVGYGWYVLRVPNGWIYSEYTGKTDDPGHAVFVKYSTESFSNNKNSLKVEYDILKDKYETLENELQEALITIHDMRSEGKSS